MSRYRGLLVWSGLAVVTVVPVVAAALSPQLAWRDAIYIAAGFAGVLTLPLLLIQPLLIGGYLTGLDSLRSRQIHRGIGAFLFALVVVHVAALWITSPPDVIDALTFSSPTQFSIWGVIAMWCVFLTGIAAMLRKKLRIRPRAWRIGHTFFAIIIVAGTIVHAMLIEGTMETISKSLLCLLIMGATVKLVVDKRVWKLGRR